MTASKDLRFFQHDLSPIKNWEDRPKCVFYDFDFSRDGRLVAFRDQLWLTVCDFGTGALRLQIELDCLARGGFRLKFTPDGTRIVVANGSGELSRATKSPQPDFLKENDMPLRPTRQHVALLSVVLFAALVRADDTSDPKVDAKLAPLARFAGEWTVDGKWSDGNELHARAVYELRLGGKILAARTYVKDGNTEYQRYESTMAWHPKKECLYEVSFAVDGNLTEHRIEAKGDDTLLLDFTPFDATNPGKVRQTLKFVDRDHHTWKVELKSDSGWQTLIDATWVRKSKP
jgi:hypothetical protein